ncbi:phosphatase inhibitor-domain-containing protein [Xylaria scruposa]|nr:phosphatase inhibitor-domain-containing protein [Xylaria scruposa]
MSANSRAQRQREQTPSSGAQTQVQVPSASVTQVESTASAQPPPRILRLRGAHPPSANRVQWADDVVDNEGMGRKSSKVCCIYHAPKAVGESSDESSSDSSSDSDSDSDLSSDDKASYDARERALAQRKAKAQQHSHGPNCNHEHGREQDGKRKPVRRPSPNAYEKQPRRKPRTDGEDSGPSGSGPARG